MTDIRFMLLTEENKTILLPEPGKDSNGELKPKFYLEEESDTKVKVMVSSFTPDPIVLKTYSSKREAKHFLTSIMEDYTETYSIFYAEVSSY